MFKKTICRLASVALSFLLAGKSQAQYKNEVVTESFTVAGNCAECEKAIEAAADIKGVKNATWDAESKYLQLTYSKGKTEATEILRQVAYAGYDNQMYLAPESAYARLKECCRYRKAENKTAPERPRQEEKPVVTDHKQHEHDGHAKEPANQAQPAVTKTEQKETVTPQTEGSGVTNVYESYFRIKDALVADNASKAMSSAKDLNESIDKVRMEKSEKREHDAWIKMLPRLKKNVQTISATKDIGRQRKAFVSLSEEIYTLAKSIKPPYEVYFDNCPMYNDGKGANWLSRDKAIRNPYYGSSMLTCGKVKETIK
jgi:hypothetical protein